MTPSRQRISEARSAGLGTAACQHHWRVRRSDRGTIAAIMSSQPSPPAHVWLGTIAAVIAIVGFTTNIFSIRQMYDLLREARRPPTQGAQLTTPFAPSTVMEPQPSVSSKATATRGDESIRLSSDASTGTLRQYRGLIYQTIGHWAVTMRDSNGNSRLIYVSGDQNTPVFYGSLQRTMKALMVGDELLITSSNVISGSGAFELEVKAARIDVIEPQIPPGVTTSLDTLDTQMRPIYVSPHSFTGIRLASGEESPWLEHDRADTALAWSVADCVQITARFISGSLDSYTYRGPRPRWRLADIEQIRFKNTCNVDVKNLAYNARFSDTDLAWYRTHQWR